MAKVTLAWVLLLCCSACAMQPIHPANGIEGEFEAFFNEPFRPTLGHEAVRLIVEDSHMAHVGIPVKMRFDIDGVNKVLLLKLKNTGYYSDGTFSRECADDPVKIAAFVVDPDARVDEIETRFHTQCLEQYLTLLLWVQTKDGAFYSTSKTIRTVYESPG